MADMSVWGERLLTSQKLASGSPYLHGEPEPTPNQVAAVLHAFADHTAIVHMLEVAPELGADRERFGEAWAMAMGVGRYLQALGDAIEKPTHDLEGGTDPGAWFAWPANAAEFAARFNAKTAEQREAWVQAAVADAQLAAECIAADHRGHIVALEHREQARLRDVQHPEFVPENVMDAAFASQREWWAPGDDARFLVVQLEERAGDEGMQVRRSPVLIAGLIESVADATYKATIAELGIVTPETGGSENG